MKLIIFLGNLGKKYEKNRHNAGWIFADFLRKKWEFSVFSAREKLFGEVSEGQKSGEKILFIKPKTFMNLSGKSALAAAQFYKIPTKNVLAVFDDKDQAFGNVRFREEGSSGGHNGIQDILGVFGTEEIARVKIGVDSPIRLEQNISTANFVLADFTADEYSSLFENVFPIAEERVLHWISSPLCLN